VLSASTSFCHFCGSQCCFHILWEQVQLITAMISDMKMQSKPDRSTKSDQVNTDRRNFVGPHCFKCKGRGHYQRECNWDGTGEYLFSFLAVTSSFNSLTCCRNFRISSFSFFSVFLFSRGLSLKVYMALIESLCFLYPQALKYMKRENY
jgi:hypothetical protein